jgi:hypothetical protein
VLIGSVAPGATDRDRAMPPRAPRSRSANVYPIRQGAATAGVPVSAINAETTPYGLHAARHLLPPWRIAPRTAIAMVTLAYSIVTIPDWTETVTTLSHEFPATDDCRRSSPRSVVWISPSRRRATPTSFRSARPSGTRINRHAVPTAAIALRPSGYWSVSTMIGWVSMVREVWCVV